MLIQLAPSSERILKKICKALYIFRSVPRRARLRKPASVVPGFAVPCLFKLSTAMAPVVLRYGFSKITWPEDHFRRKALENGAKLCKAKYVYDVEETVSCRDSDSQVAAKCHSQVQLRCHTSGKRAFDARSVITACSCPVSLRRV